MTARMFSYRNAVLKLYSFNNWLLSVPSKHKIIIAGNHDSIVEDLTASETKKIISNGMYIENEEFQIGKYKFWATPLSHGDSPNKAFQSALFSKVVHESCPKQTDILITHGYCKSLKHRVNHKIHIWGHSHNSYGVRFDTGTSINELNSMKSATLSVCAPVMDGVFQLTQPPIVLDIPSDPAQLHIYP